MEFEMKSFVINRDTWHYKLNQDFFNPFYSMSQWEEKHADFCSYWRATIFRLMALSVLVCCALIILSGFVVLSLQEPIVALTGVFLLCFVVAFVFSAVAFFDWYENRKSNRLTSDEPESLFVQRYRAYKGKFCPMVNFTDDK
jgi:hypothetical protein